MLTRTKSICLVAIVGVLAILAIVLIIANSRTASVTETLGGAATQNLNDCNTQSDLRNCRPASDIGPTILSTAPEGALAETSSIILEVNTNNIAVCKYSTSSTATYDQMTNMLTALGNTHISEGISVKSGTEYHYFVRCVDGAGNRNSHSYPISFRVKGFLG